MRRAIEVGAAAAVAVAFAACGACSGCSCESTVLPLPDLGGEADAGVDAGALPDARVVPDAAPIVDSACAAACEVDWVPLDDSPIVTTLIGGTVPIYDEARDRLITNSAVDNRMFELPLSGPGALRWRPLEWSGAPPPVLEFSRLLLDQRRDRVILRGCIAPSCDAAGTWALELSGARAWSAIEAGVPGPWFDISVIDPEGDRLIDLREDGEVWARELTGGTEFRRLEIAGERVIAGASVFDPSQRAILSAGSLADGSRAGIWSLSLRQPMSWSYVGPPLPHGGRIALDQTRRELILCTKTPAVLSLTSSSAWVPIEPLDPGPLQMRSASCVYDAGRRRLLYAGGEADVSKYFTDVWALPLAPPHVFELIVPEAGPSANQWNNHIIYDEARRRLVVARPHWATGGEQEIWTRTLGDAAGWSKLAPFGPAPLARCYGSFTFDVANDRFLLRGGANRNEIFTDFWELTASWREIRTATAAPQGVFVYDRARMRVLNVTATDPVTLWSLAGDQWSPVVTRGVAPSGGSAFLDPLGDRLIVWSGRRFYALDLGRAEWSVLFEAETPETIAFLPAIGFFEPTRQLFIAADFIESGGACTGTELYSLDLTPGATPAWQRTIATGLRPSPDEHTLVSTELGLVMIGYSTWLVDPRTRRCPD